MSVASKQTHQVELEGQEIQGVTRRRWEPSSAVGSMKSMVTVSDMMEDSGEWMAQ